MGSKLSGQLSHWGVTCPYRQIALLRVPRNLADGLVNLVWGCASGPAVAGQKREPVADIMSPLYDPSHTSEQDVDEAVRRKVVEQLVETTKDSLRRCRPRRLKQLKSNFVNSYRSRDAVGQHEENPS